MPSDMEIVTLSLMPSVCHGLASHLLFGAWQTASYAFKPFSR
jgi:hypothetical protein